MRVTVIKLWLCALLWVPLHGEQQPEWIELSYQFNNETIYWPTALAFSHIKVHENFTADGYYYSSYDISASEHGGTHLDAPRHFSAGKWTTDQIPLDRLIGPAIKIDVSSKAAQVIFLPTSYPTQPFIPRHAVWYSFQFLFEFWGQFNKTFTSVAIVPEVENNGYACKLKV